MPAADRRVRHLRIACRRPEHAALLRNRLEDALRTASLRDDGRFIIVRKLALGRLGLSASATTWSRRLEERFQRSSHQIVPANHPSAAHAWAVEFANLQEPWLVLAERAATGRASREWFWPQAAPGWRLAMSAQEALRLAFRRLAAEHATAALGLVRRLTQRSGAGGELTLPLLGALTAADVASVLPGADLAPAAGASEPRRRDTEQAAVVGIPASPSGLLRQLAELPSEDPRALLLVAAQLASTGAVPSVNRLLVIADEWRRRAGVRAIQPEVVEFGSSTHRPEARTAARPMLKAPTHDSQPDSQPALTTTRSTKPNYPSLTAAGGLFFLVRLFENLGLPADWKNLSNLSNESHPACSDLPWWLLRGALRLAVGQADDAFSALPTPSTVPPLGFRSRTLLRTHHLGHRLTGLSLREIVRRPARVAWTETHVDTFLPLADADVRIRRAGLDLDPDWVPWLGRVVRFHYVTREEW